jgi:CheY-like chemotaxis protein
MRGDPYKIKQIIGNLASNALKFTPSLGTVSFSVKRYNLNGDYVIMECTDTGCGISKKQQRNLFRKIVNFDAQTSAALHHRQSHKATSTKAGSGLGLYITKGLVELHGGSISVKSEGHNKGSTFVVKLPFDHNYKAGLSPMANFCCDFLGLSGLYHLIFDPFIECYNMTMNRFAASRPRRHKHRGLNSEVSDSCKDSSANESSHSFVFDNGMGDTALEGNHKMTSPTVLAGIADASGESLGPRQSARYEGDDIEAVYKPIISTIGNLTSRTDDNYRDFNQPPNHGLGVIITSTKSSGGRNSNCSGSRTSNASEPKFIEEMESAGFRLNSKKLPIVPTMMFEKSTKVYPALTLTETSSGQVATSVNNSSNAGDYDDDQCKVAVAAVLELQPVLSSMDDSLDKNKPSISSARAQVQQSVTSRILTPIESHLSSSSGSRQQQQHQHLPLRPTADPAFAKRGHLDRDNSTLSNKSGVSGVHSSVGTLSRQLSLRPRQAPTKPINTESAAWLTGFHVLLVDDAMINLKMVGLLMKRLGSAYATATNGAEAVAMVTAKGADAFDFVIMDNYMPVMDGPTAATQLRALGYTRPIIGLTGHALGEDLMAFKEAGANAVLTKPLEVAELKSILTLFLNTSH